MAGGYDTIRDMLRADERVDYIEEIKDGMFIAHFYTGEKWLVQTDRIPT